MKRVVRLLSKRYDLMNTRYKFLEIEINVGPPNYVEIAMDDYREYELSVSLETSRVSMSSNRIFTSCFEMITKTIS